MQQHHQPPPRRALCLDCHMTAAGNLDMLRSATGSHIYRTGHRVVDEHGNRLDRLAECARCGHRLEDVDQNPGTCPMCNEPAAWSPVGLEVA